MLTKYKNEVKNNAIDKNLCRLTGQIYKLLPYREEGIDWEKPLRTILEEISGMGSLFEDYLDFNSVLLTLQCKLEGLFLKKEETDFEEFRCTIFDCINLVEVLKRI